MSDRELLELAAKAAGLHQHYGMNAQRKASGQPGLVVQSGRGNELWDPLENDGDALRLAVKIRLDVRIGFIDTEASPYTSNGWSHKGAIESHAGDPLAATRRAIVRAAAEITPPQPTP